MNLITELIINFKTQLIENFYLKTIEEDNFHYWLERNTSYINGEYIFNNNHVITESEQEDSSTGDDTLKELIITWVRSKYNKQLYWSNLTDSRFSYVNGGVNFDEYDYVEQTVTGEVSFEVYYNNKYYYYLEIGVSPVVSGQVFSFTPEYSIYRAHSSNPGSYIVEITSDEVIEDDVTLIVKPYVNDDVIYSGGQITVTPIN